MKRWVEEPLATIVPDGEKGGLVLIPTPTLSLAISSYLQPSRAGDALHMHRAHTQAMGYAVGIYDNAMRPQMCGNLAPSPHYVNVRASRGYPSTSSEDSRDYVNIPTAKEIAETLASASNPPGNLFILPSTKELALSEEIDEGCGNASDCTSLGSPGTENSDPLSDGEGSSQTSNDYVNMAELDVGTPQGKQLQGMFQCRRDYENVPPGPSSNKQQEEEVTSSNTDHVEGRTDGPETHTPPAVQSGSFLALKDHVACQSSAHSETGPWEDAEETSSEDSHDYENVCAAEAGARGWAAAWPTALSWQTRTQPPSRQATWSGRCCQIHPRWPCISVVSFG